MVIDSMTVALLDFNNSPDSPWQSGTRLMAGRSVREINEQIDSLSQSVDHILFFNSKYQVPSTEELKRISKSRGDLWHGGKYPNGSGFTFLSYIKPCWMLNLSPQVKTACVSWKIDYQAALIPVSVFEQYGLLHEGFSSPEAAFVNWGYNFIHQGGVPVYRPELANKNSLSVFETSDQVLFLQFYFPVFWIRWALWRAFCKNNLSLKSFLKYWNVKPTRSKPKELLPRLNSTLGPVLEYQTVSVVIITLNRYRYLRSVIRQLVVQTVPVSEIIIVDASPASARETDWIDEFDKKKVKVFYSEVIGQCTQRNMGIQAAAGELIYFCDDDMEEIPVDHLEKHLNNLITYCADVSSGLPDEVGIKPIDRTNMRPAVSTVFPTNDSLVFKSKLYEAGLFDTKIDKGQSEDHDLGIRIYLSGGLMILDPQLKSLHLRAGSGGLREHGARVVTAALSKRSYVRFRLLHLTEIYLNLKYFTRENVKELILISTFATFRLHGSGIKKIMKFFIAIFYLPVNFLKLRNRFRAANKMIDFKMKIEND